MALDKVSLAIEMDGQAYFVVLPQESLKLLVKMAEGLSDNGALPVKKCPDGFAFTDYSGLTK